MTKKQANKPLIETMINPAAIALMVLGVQQVTEGNLMGLGLLVFAMGAEWFKYWGRRKYW